MLQRLGSLPLFRPPAQLDTSGIDGFQRLARHHVSLLPHLRNTPFILTGLLAGWPALIRWQNPNYFLLPDWQTRRIPTTRFRDGDAHLLDSVKFNWFDHKDFDALIADFEPIIDGSPGCIRRIDRFFTSKFGHFVWNYLIPTWPIERPDEVAYGGKLATSWKRWTKQFDTKVPTLIDAASRPPRRPDLLSYHHVGLSVHFPEIVADCGDQIDWLLQKYAAVKTTPLASWVPSDVWEPLHYWPQSRVFCNVVGRRTFALMRPSRGAEMHASPTVPLLSFVANPFCVDRDFFKGFPPDSEIFAVTLEPGESLFVPKGWWLYWKAETTSMVSLFEYAPVGVDAHKLRVPRTPKLDWESTTQVTASPEFKQLPKDGAGGDPRRYQLPPR